MRSFHLCPPATQSRRLWLRSRLLDSQRRLIVVWLQIFSTESLLRRFHSHPMMSKPLDNRLAVEMSSSLSQQQARLQQFRRPCRRKTRRRRRTLERKQQTVNRLKSLLSHFYRHRAVILPYHQNLLLLSLLRQRTQLEFFCQ